MYFSKKVYTVYRQSPRSWGILKNFCVKTFNCKLQKKFGEQNVLVTPPIIQLGEQLLPRFPHLWTTKERPKDKDLNERSLPCPRPTASHSHNQPLLLVSGGRDSRGRVGLKLKAFCPPSYERGAQSQVFKREIVPVSGQTASHNMASPYLQSMGGGWSVGVGAQSTSCLDPPMLSSCGVFIVYFISLIVSICDRQQLQNCINRFYTSALVFHKCCN